LFNVKIDNDGNVNGAESVS